MSHLFFQELDGLLPVSSSVGNSSASIDFCRRTIFVIKMADLSKHVLKRKYYCKFSSRASRNVLLIFTCPFRSTKRACELVLPESFKCLTLICWVGTFQRLIHTTLVYHSHFTPLKFWFWFFQCSPFLFARSLVTSLHGLHYNKSGESSEWKKKRLKGPLFRLTLRLSSCSQTSLWICHWFSPQNIWRHEKFLIRTLRPHGLPQSWAGWWTAEKQRQHLSGKSAVATLDSWEKHRDRLCSPSPR